MNSPVDLLKTCTKCGNTMSPTMFYKDVRYKDELQPHCKACNKLRGQLAKRRAEEKKPILDYSDVKVGGIYLTPRGLRAKVISVREGYQYDAFDRVVMEYMPDTIILQPHLLRHLESF